MVIQVMLENKLGLAGGINVLVEENAVAQLDRFFQGRLQDGWKVRR